MSGSFGVIYFNNPKTGEYEYRVRGIGPTYDHFYSEWVPSSSYECTGSDWPWDYFRFKDSADHERLIEAFGDAVWEDDDEYDEQDDPDEEVPLVSIDPKVNAWISETLRKAIEDEINREILESIKGNKCRPLI